MRYVLEGSVLASATEIISQAEASLRVDPSFAGAYLPMAVAEGLIGHHEEAMSDLTQASRISPRDSSIGVWYMEMGRQLFALTARKTDQARAHHAKALLIMFKAKPNDAQVLNLNSKLSVAVFRAHNSAFVDVPPGFREALIKAGLPEE